MTATVTAVESGSGSAAVLRSPYRLAARDILPVALSVAPFGVVIGLAARAIDQGLAGGLLGGFAIYGGSAHLSSLTLLGAGANLTAILATVVVIQARLMVYGAAIAPLFQQQPRWFRWLGPHFLVDQTYALATGRADLAEPTRFRRYWLTIAALLTVIWLASITVGMVFGPVLPASSPLDFAATAVFIGLLAPRLASSRSAVIAATAGLVAVAGSDLPSGTGLIAGVAAGLAVATVMEVRTR